MKQVRSQVSLGKLWLSVAVIVSMLMVACGAAAPEPSAAPAQEVAKPKALATPATAEPAAAKPAADKPKKKSGSKVSKNFPY